MKRSFHRILCLYFTVTRLQSPDVRRRNSAVRRGIFRIAGRAAESTDLVIADASYALQRTRRFIQLVFSISHGLLAFVLQSARRMPRSGSLSALAASST